MSASFDDWANDVDQQAAEQAAAGDDTSSRLSAAFAAHYDDERRRILTVPEQLAAARKARHVTQAELARMAGIDQAAISRIERGQINTSVDTVSRLSKPLGLRVALVDEQGRAVSI